MATGSVCLDVISSSSGYKYFVFCLLRGYHGFASNWIVQNYWDIGLRIGRDSLLLRGISDEFDREVIERYTRSIEEYIDQLLQGYRFSGPVMPLEPYVLLTDQNPHLADGTDPNIFYFIPLSAFDDDEQMYQLFGTISRCCQTGEFSDLENLILSKFGRNTPFNLIEVINDVFELKPNVAGLGINLNALISRVLRRRYINPPKGCPAV